MAAGLIDIDKPGKYPIVLSDALLGKTSKEVYTAIRYNHKADASSNSTLSDMRLEPSESDPISYDLSYSDNSDKYTYQGVRTTGDGKYVLIFDPVKKHFVLHRIDSTFDMNLISAPWNQDASELRSQYTQLEPETKPQPPATQRRASKAQKKAPAPKAEPKQKKQEKAKKPKPLPVKEPTPEPEEAEDSGDDLEIEWGDSAPPAYESAPIFRTSLDVDMDAEGEDEDAEGEEYEDEANQDVDHLKLPSPANNNAGGMSEEELEMDLEAELEQDLELAFEKSAASANSGEDSDESEEE